MTQPLSPRSRPKADRGRLTLEIGGRTVPLAVRRNRRARRLVLTIDAENEGAVVTLPARVPVAEGLALARDQADWIVRRLKALPPRVAFADGVVVPILGVDHRIRHRAGGPRPVWREAGEVFVCGRPEHLGRRLADWLRAEARRQIAGRARAKAARLGRRLGRIVVRDTRSRWGSCSTEGNLSFSWRLVMAPEAVLDYVVAHEVAHLAVADHGRRFWRTVADLHGDAGAARAWLNRHGSRLHRYG